MNQTCEPGQERSLRNDGFELVTRVIELFPFAIIFEAVIFYKGCLQIQGSKCCFPLVSQLEMRNPKLKTDSGYV